MKRLNTGVSSEPLILPSSILPICSRHFSVVQSRRENAMIESDSASRPAASRWYSAGRSLLDARFPVAPKITNVHGRLSGSWASFISALLHGVAAEALAHFCQHLVGVIALALAGKTHHQGQRHHWRRNAQFDRFKRGPAAFAGVADIRLNVLERLVLCQKIRRPIKHPRLPH